VTNAENHTTILCIAPSPLEEGIIWVSTDDGQIQLTQDGGETWTLVSKELTSGKKGRVPQATWSPHVEASRHDSAVAYVVFEDHRRSNWTPYVYVTRDFGKTWKSLVTAEIDGFCHVIREDPVKPDLLYLGTEFGLFVSFNGGQGWMKWTQGLPSVSVRDIGVHPRENDLIIGTHGRSIYIIDDISPLREIAGEVLSKKLHLFKIQDAFQFQSGRLSSFLSPGDTAFMGENKRRGAVISYHLIPTEKKKEDAPDPERDEMRQRMLQRMRQMGGSPRMGQMGAMGETSSRVAITIENEEGKVIGRMNGTEKKGINRVYWNFREETARQTTGAARSSFRSRRGGLTVLPGNYTVKIKYDKEEVAMPLVVKTDPRLDIDIAVLKANRELYKNAQGLSNAMTSANQQIQDVQKAIKTIRENARNNRSPKTRDLMKAATDLDKKMKELTEILSPTPKKQGIADRSAGLSSYVMRAVYGLARGYEPVSQAAKVRLEKAQAKTKGFVEKFNAVFQTDVEQFKKLMVESGFSLFKPFKQLKVNK